MHALKKTLGFTDVFAIAAGAMISSGLFVLPGIAFSEIGPPVVICYLLAAVMMVPSLFAEMELASAMPRTGGDYFFIDRSLGVMGGTIGGLANWFFISLKSAFALVGIASFIQLFYPGATEQDIRHVAALCAIVFILLNIISVSASGKIEIILVFWLLAILAAFMTAGLPRVVPERVAGITDASPAELLGIAGMVFVSFGGLTTISSVAGEVKHPRRNLVLGLLAAFVVVSAIYIVAVYVTVGTLDPTVLARSYVPLADASLGFMGRSGELLLSVAAFLAFATTANAGIISASRYPVAMSRDDILPLAFARINRRTGTPIVAILATGAFIMLVIMLLDIRSLVKAASTLMLLSFIFVNLALIVMRQSNLASYRPQVRVILYPLLPVAGILVYVTVIFQIGVTALVTASGFLLAAAIWYMIYVRRRVDRESALMLLVRRAAARELVNSRLDDELKDILFERDQIERDRFDHLVEGSPVLNIREPVDFGRFALMAGEELAERTGLSARRIASLLKKREAESPTVLEPGLAVPHLILPGRGRLEMLIVRCRKGIDFGHGEPVTTAFVIAGTKDERNFHLRVLMSLAQIVSGKDFSKRWKRAVSPNELRNTLLLSARRREVFHIPWIGDNQAR